MTGRLTQSSSGNVTFEYDEGYQSLDDATPLSLSMPLAVGVHKRRAVLPYLQGLLPDSDEALSAIARRYSVSAANPFALLEHVGGDAAGAVQIVAPGTLAPDAAGKRARVRKVTTEEVAAMLSHVVSEYADGVPYYDTGGRFSLAGAQPKIALHKLADGSWGVPRDATPTTHILKPVAGTLRRMDVVEQLTMYAAEALGNRVARSELQRIGEWDVFVAERYDRAIVNRAWRRLHQEDLCQALSVLPAKKYQHGDGGPGVAHVARLIQSLPLASDRRATGEAFYRALVFNVVAGCTDAHAKNYSLMLDRRSVRLAPLYDLLSYAAYWDGSARIESAMSVGGEYSLARISAAKLEQAGALFGLGREGAAEIVRATRTRTYSAFESARSAIGVHEKIAVAVADDLLRGLRALPLVVT
jgi:serine/threonine-protein kinase HipA